MKMIKFQMKKRFSLFYKDEFDLLICFSSYAKFCYLNPIRPKIVLIKFNYIQDVIT